MDMLSDLEDIDEDEDGGRPNRRSSKRSRRRDPAPVVAVMEEKAWRGEGLTPDDIIESSLAVFGLSPPTPACPYIKGNF